MGKRVKRLETFADIRVAKISDTVWIYIDGLRITLCDIDAYGLGAWLLQLEETDELYQQESVNGFRECAQYSATLDFHDGSGDFDSVTLSECSGNCRRDFQHGAESG
jgi:hypothetical protein